jgi:hypothetical protein
MERGRGTELPLIYRIGANREDFQSVRQRGVSMQITAAALMLFQYKKIIRRLASGQDCPYQCFSLGQQADYAQAFLPQKRLRVVWGNWCS